MVNIAKLDPAIIDNILVKFLEKHDPYAAAKQAMLGEGLCDDDGLDTLNLDFNYFPQYKLYKLLFVCKGWHKAVERRLYRSIGFGSEEPEWAEVKLEEGLFARGKAHVYDYDAEVYEDKDDDDDDGWEDEDEDEGSDGSGEYLERYNRLLRTFSRNPQLTVLVHELRLAVMDNPSPATKAYGQLLSLCPHVRRVVLHGWSYHHIQDIRDALRGTRCLESLVVHAHSLRDIQCDDFMKLDELFYYLITFWPNLRSAVFHNEAIRSIDELVDWDGSRRRREEETREREEREKRERQERRERGEEVEEPEEIPPWPFPDPIVERKLPSADALQAIITSPPSNACANLREFTIREGDSLHTAHLRALARIAPNIKVLRVKVDTLREGNDPDELLEALQTWAPTLEDAIIRPYGTYTEHTLVPFADASFFAQFSVLHTLRTGSALIAPAALVDLPKLTRLDYIVAKPPQDVGALVKALPKFKALKRLEVRPQRVYSSYDLDDAKAPQEQLAKLKEVCRAKGIKLESAYGWR